MEGLIQANQAPESRDDLTPEKVSQGIQIPDEFKEAYERVVAAGMQVMFSKQSNQAAVDSIQRGDGPLAQRLGMAIAGLIGMIVKESNGTVPPQVLIPAAVELLSQAADFLRKAGIEPVNNKVFGDAMDVMITAILQSAKLDVQKIAGFIEQKAGQGGAAPAAGAQPMMGA